MPLGDRSRAGRVVHPGRHLHAGAGGGVRRGAREDADEVRYEDGCVSLGVHLSNKFPCMQVYWGGRRSGIYWAVLV